MKVDRALAAHDQAAAAGHPLLTEKGIAYLQHLLEAARADAGIAAEPPRPRWDDDRRRLFLGERLLKEFPRGAPAQTALLAAFERLGWPPGPVPCPLAAEPGEEPDEYRHGVRETVKNLNRHLPAGTIHFREDRGRVWWERAADREP